DFMPWICFLRPAVAPTSFVTISSVTSAPAAAAGAASTSSPPPSAPSTPPTSPPVTRFRRGIIAPSAGPCGQYNRAQLEMTVYPSSRVQAERTIAAGRVALAASSLFAVWLDPAEPARFTQVNYGLHLAFVSYAVVLGVMTWRWEGGTRLPIVTHVVDIVVFSVFQYFPFAQSSPFFMYFMFSMFCGAIRWGPRGTLVPGSVVIVPYAIMTASMSRTLGPDQNELNRIIIRTVYLVVTAGMLVYLGRYEARLRSGIEHLARWPVPAGKSTERALTEFLEHASGMLGAMRALVVWEVAEEPGIQIASWSANGL